MDSSADPTTPTTTSDAARFVSRSRRFSDVLAAADGRWDAPTPCEGWSVRDVVEHVTATQDDFLRRHDLLTDAGAAIGGSDPSAFHRAHAERTAALLTDDVADRRFDGYFGPTTIGATMADFYGWDLLVHSWDVARATGQPDPFDDAEAEVLGAAADRWGPALYSEGICAPAVDVPASASAVDRLLGRLGRDPGWTPSR